MLPPSTQKRLHNIFRDLEKEFEAIFLENVQLKEKVRLLEQRGAEGMTDVDRERNNTDEPDAFENVLKTFTKKNAFKTRHKLKAHTSKIVSSFKPPQFSCSLVKEYKVVDVNVTVIR